MTRLTDLIRDQRPLVLEPHTTVKKACEQLRENRRSAVLVVHPDDGYLVGIFTGRDAICRVIACGLDSEKTTLAEVMTTNPTRITPYTTAIEALRLMWDGGFRHLPVTERGKIVGVVMRRDFKSEDLSRLEEEREFWEHMR